MSNKIILFSKNSMCFLLLHKERSHKECRRDLFVINPKFSVDGVDIVNSKDFEVLAL